MFLNSSALKTVFEKLRVHDGLVWTVGVTEEVTLRFKFLQRSLDGVCVVLIFQYGPLAKDGCSQTRILFIHVWQTILLLSVTKATRKRISRPVALAFAC